MNLDPLHDLAQRWRADAERLRDYGADAQADVLEGCADDLAAALERYRLELLTLEQAAAEAGVAYDTAQKRVARGEWPNAGEKHRPRVRRCDVRPDLDAPTPEPAHSDAVDALVRERLTADGERN